MLTPDELDSLRRLAGHLGRNTPNKDDLDDYDVAGRVLDAFDPYGVIDFELTDNERDQILSCFYLGSDE